MGKRKIVESRPGIYKIKNNSNGKFYIGSSINVYNRICRHKSSLRGNNHFNQKLQNSYNKYGENSFSFDIILTCSEKQVKYYEQLLLDYYIPAGCLYNLSTNADGVNATVFTVEEKSHIRSLFLAGISIVKISKQYGISHIPITRVLHEWGIDTKVKLVEWKNKYSKEFFLERRQQGSSFREIAEEIGASSFLEVATYCRKVLKIPTKNVRHLDWTTEQVKLLHSMKSHRKTESEIADKLEISKSAVNRKWKKISQSRP